MIDSRGDAFMCSGRILMFMVSCIFLKLSLQQIMIRALLELTQTPRQINGPCLYLFPYNHMLKLHSDLLLKIQHGGREYNGF